MEKWEQRFLAFIGIAVTVAFGLAGIGFSIQAGSGDSDPWFYAGAWIGGVAIFALLMTFVIWPALVRLPRLRRRIRGPVVDAADVPPVLAVIRVTYGSGDTRPDVTEAVEAQMRDGRLNFVADNALFGDPTPNVPKLLALRYTLNGKRHDLIVKEGDMVALP